MSWISASRIPDNPIALALLAAAVLCPPQAGADSTPRRTEESFPAQPGDTLTVRAKHGGDVLVTGWDKEEVHVLAIDRKSNMVVTFETTDQGVSVVARAEDEGAHNISTDMKLEIQVPRRYRMDLKTSGGDVEIADLEGAMEVQTMGGDILARRCAGEADLQTMGGDITVREGRTDGRLRTMGGDIEVETSSEEIDAETMGGDIEIRCSGRIRASTAGGDIEIRLTGVDSDCDASTTGGDIRLVIPQDYSADFSVHAMEARSEIDGLDLRREGARFGTGTYHGKLGDGAHNVRLSTTAGDVEIEPAKTP